MKKRCVGALVAIMLAGGAADPGAGEYKLIETPALTSAKPRYGLLAFGMEGETRAWIILDGDALYVDRDGDGKLTGADERVEAKKGERNGATRRAFQLGAFRAPGEDADYEVSLVQEVMPDGEELVNISAQFGDELVQQVGGLFGEFNLADRAEDAPTLRFGGPLTMALRPDFKGKLRYGFPSRGDDDPLKNLRPEGVPLERQGFIIVVIGTPGTTASALVSNQTGGIPEGCHPVGELEFANHEPGGSPIRVKFALPEQTCADGFMAVFEFPKDAADGPATLRLSFPDWRDDMATPAMRATKVRPAEMQVTISRYQPEPEG